jgi:hypothetical protein
MSYVKSLEIEGDFYGVTENKGEIIVNDGLKNNKLPVNTDGYVLSLDSSQSLGLKWVPMTSGSSLIEHDQFILTTLPFQTNSISPIAITEFQNTPSFGTALILCSFTYSLNRNGRVMTVGVYRNNVLLANSTVSVGALTSTRTIFYTQFIDVFNGTQTLDIKVNIDNSNTNIVITEGFLEVLMFDSSFQVVITGVPFTTNEIVPVPVADMTYTPPNGIYLILLSMIFTLNRSNQTATIGLYTNNVLMTETTRVTSTPTSTKTVFQTQYITSFSGTDVLLLKVNSSNTNTDLLIYERSLILIPLG